MKQQNNNNHKTKNMINKFSHFLNFSHYDIGIIGGFYEKIKKL